MKAYNKRAVVIELARLGYNIAYVTICGYEKKGFIKPAGTMPNGTREHAFYTDKEIHDFVKAIPRLIKQGKIHTPKSV